MAAETPHEREDDDSREEKDVKAPSTTAWAATFAVLGDFWPSSCALLSNSGAGRTSGAFAFAFVLDGACAAFVALPRGVGADNALADFLLAFDGLRSTSLALLRDLGAFFGCLRHGVFAGAWFGACVRVLSGFRARRFATDVLTAMFSSLQTRAGVVTDGALLERAREGLRANIVVAQRGTDAAPKGKPAALLACLLATRVARTTAVPICYSYPVQGSSKTF